MKIAIHNSFAGKPCAETELSRRICLAANNIDWQAIEVSDPIEINDFHPDFVLVMHFNTPKLWKFPTYGCMWNPPIFFDRYELLISELEKFSNTKKDAIKMKYANVFTYDGYLSSSQKVDDWLHTHLSKTAKQFFIAPFFTSCNQTEYVAPSIQDPRLVYVGINWDGARFKQLFQGLDSKEFMEVYGNKWNYLKKSYKGVLPFDGVSVLDTLRRAGVGLCLHKTEHRDAETPSMRIFEIVASGAIAICGEHKFIRNAFGDTVLYVDTNAGIDEQIRQISNHIDWIKNYPQAALAMSEQAHAIFLKSYTFEQLLLGIVPHHQDLIQKKGFVKSNFEPQFLPKQIQFIVRIGDHNLSMIKRCLDSIVNQTYGNVAVILVQYKEVVGLSELLQEYTRLIPIKLIISECTGFRSSQLKDGIKAVTSPYFGILDGDDIIFPNHAFVLIELLEKYEFAGVAYSGAIKVLEDNNSIDKELAYFQDFDLKKIAQFQKFFTSNSFIARSILDVDIYKEDPKLAVAEDFFLVLQLCQKSIFVFSYETTCEFYWRINNIDNATLSYNNLIKIDLKKPVLKDIDQVTNRLLEMFWNEDFIQVINGDSYLREVPLIKPEIKKVKLSEYRFSKSEKLLGAEKNVSSFSIYNFLRTVYLRLSKGGNFNKNPNLIGRFLVFIKNSYIK